MVAMTETGNEKLITKIAVSIVALFLLVSWIPAFGLPLGDSHEGRVLGQFSLHMKNFWSNLKFTKIFIKGKLNIINVFFHLI